MREILGRLLTRVEAWLADLHLLRPEIQLGVQRIRGLRDVGEQQFDRHLLARDCPRAVGGDLHALSRVTTAGCRQNALALDLHHARAAVAVGAHALHVAEPRHFDAEVIGGLEDRLRLWRGDGPSVQRERDHRSGGAGPALWTGRSQWLMHLRLPSGSTS